MHSLFGYVVVFLGAGVGGALRHGANRAGLMLLRDNAAWMTVIVNVSGSFVMGLIAGWFAFRAEGGSQALRLFLTTGILGGYTTFSAFSLDTALMWERGEMGAAALYVVGSVALSILGVFAGLALIRATV
jgi:CrcB protein